MCFCFFCLFKQKTAYEMRISDWSSDVCSSDLWRVAAIPLGGYVQFKGDMNPASIPDAEALAAASPEERAGSFHCKPLWQRALIVLAGPATNLQIGRASCRERVCQYV